MDNSGHNVPDTTDSPQAGDDMEAAPTESRPSPKDCNKPGVPPVQPTLPPQSRWPRIVSFFTHPIRPIWAFKRIAQEGLIKPFLFHVVMAAAGLLLFFFVMSSIDLLRSGNLLDVGSNFIRVFGDIWQTAKRHPNEFLLGTAVFVGVVELSFAGCALLFTPWGARDEEFKTSLSHAFRQSWLHTSNIVAAIIICAVASGMLDFAAREWKNTTKPVDAPLKAPPNISAAQRATSPEWNVYLKLCKENQSHYWREYQQWQRTWPWWVRYEGEVIFVVWCAGVFWVACSFATAIGARRRVIPMVRPPLCENCGYNLTGTDRNSRCPECGELVELSFNKHLRTGPAWQRLYDRKRIPRDVEFAAPRGLKPAAQGMDEPGNVYDVNDAIMSPTASAFSHTTSPVSGPASPLTKGGLRGVESQIDSQEEASCDIKLNASEDRQASSKRHLLRTYLNTAIFAIRNPTALGRQLSLTRHATAYRSFVALNLVFTLISMVVGQSLYFYVVEGWRLSNQRSLDDCVPVVVFLSLAVTAGLFVFSQLAALISGIGYRIRAKRNVLAGAQQAASYLSCYLLCWVIVASLSGVVMMAVADSDWFKPMLGDYWANYDVIATIIWLVPNAITLIYYFVLVSRATAATQYANS